MQVKMTDKETQASAQLVINAIKEAIKSDGSNIDWEGLTEEWEDFFDYKENKGIKLGLDIAIKAWGEGELTDLMENRAYYRDLIEEVEGKGMREKCRDATKRIVLDFSKMK